MDVIEVKNVSYRNLPEGRTEDKRNGGWNSRVLSLCRGQGILSDFMNEGNAGIFLRNS